MKLENEKQQNSTLSEQLHNPTEESEKEAASIPLTHIHDYSLSWLCTGPLIKVTGLNTSHWDLYILHVTSRNKMNDRILCWCNEN